MVSRLAVVAIDANDVDLVARFWCDVLGWTIRDRETESSEDTEDAALVSIGPPDDPRTGIDVIRVPETKTMKNRLHLDLRADGSSTADELARLLDLGARRVDVGQDPDVSWVVLADPEGNEFCLLSRTVAEAYG